MFCWPIHCPRIRSDRDGEGFFGAARGEHPHFGVDLVGEPGTVVLAPSAGRVQRHGVCYSPSGHPIKDKLSLIVIEFGLGWWKLLYIEPTVPIGDEVEAGQIVGILQNVKEAHASDIMENHLHVELILRPTIFEKKKDSICIDPYALFKAAH